MTLKDRTFKGVPRQPKNFHNKIKLIAYCLMPNHFHFIVWQKGKNEVSQFMQSILGRYALYFNKQYKRSGALFQSRSKAVLVNKDDYLLHLSRYIHLNPRHITESLEKAYSTYAEYLGLRNTSWVSPSPVLSFFRETTLLELKRKDDYKFFVESYAIESASLLGDLVIEDEE